MKTFLTHLECSVCGDRHSPHEIQTFCRSCGKPLLARYDLRSAKTHVKKEDLDRQSPSLWRYSPLLPIERPENIVSLGEVMTPILHLKRLAEKISLENLLMKDEGHLPTGSFKARGLAMAVSKAKELGVRSLCIPSAGNAAGALAAYAAKAGMRSTIFLPEDTPEANIVECKMYGAWIRFVKGTISDAARTMQEEKKNNPDWFDVSTLKEPYRLEGKKTMGYELAEQLGWVLPDVIIYPTGGGTGLIGMWKAFDEMEQLGWIGPKRPRMISVQSSGCAPIVKAFRENKRKSEFWENAATIASGLRVPKAFADHLILDAIYASNGNAVEASDDEIRRAMREIAREEGLFICPEGAATLVALRKLVEAKSIKRGETIVLFNTATGLKYPAIMDDEKTPSHFEAGNRR
ncbi:MAG TPA: threonine synthase [Bacteroidota bacterium]|nr:threonine synthase [Bacteroidota bacterium]